MEVNADDIKAEEEGEGGWWGFKAVRGAQPRPFLCSPPIEFGGMGKSLGSHTRNVAYQPGGHRPAAPTDSSSPARQNLSYWTLMTVELALEARFLRETLLKPAHPARFPRTLRRALCTTALCREARTT